ncbi:hypothetical protein [Alistipes finegoldii]
MPKKFSAYKGTARSHLAMGKIRGGESLTEVPKILHYGFRAGLFPVQYYNRFGTKKSIGADWSGLERTSKPKRFTLLYIASGIKESVCEP